MITLYNMDVMKALKQMPSESVDMQICSPPYWGLRDYGVDGQIGLEPDFNDYIKRMCDIFDEVKRVLKKDGTCWVNLGDTYFGGGGGNYGKELNKTDTGQYVTNFMNRMDYYTTKCLICIPERFVLEMINRGWILRNKIIWHKPNHMPTSVKDRFANSWEYLFMFSKSKKYYFDLDNVREPHKEGTPQADNDLKRMMSGRQEFKGIRSDCKYCGGTGIDPETMNKCLDCKGKGKLYDVQKSFVAGNPKGRNPDDAWQYSEQVEEPKGHTSFKQRTAYARKVEGKNHDHCLDNPLGKNPGDIIQEPNHPKGDPAINSMRLPPQANQPNAFHPLGKNPDDILSDSKYEGTSGHSNRQGFQREPSFKEKRVHDIIQLQIAEYLRKYITKIQKPILDKEFGKYTWTHWIRTDESGASLPSPEDWVKLKEILNFDNRFDKIMTETEVYLDDGLMWKNKPKNPSDFWDITTQPYKEAHFAVFPEKLVERPIKTTPKQICKKCGKSRERIIEKEEIEYNKCKCGNTKQKRYDICFVCSEKLGLSKGMAYKGRKIPRNQHWEKRETTTKGWTSCKCNAGFRPAVILDIFAGSGTTAVVSRKYHRDCILIEIKKEYCDLTYKRLFGENQTQLVNSWRLIK